mmetsp:Transcript_41017/g.47167  ORF Transcript_41017/g.47167 Transcript_41017/m.47167 type:complete len:166 (-) Transcript_41017:446-943(-)
MTSATHLWFFVGNLTQDEAIRISRKADKAFPVEKVCRDECHQKRVVKLSGEKDTVLKVRSSNPGESNSAILRYYQSKPIASVRQEMLHKAVFKYIDNPSYDFLRTQSQLGYIAYSIEMNFRKVLGGGFVVQSSDYTPEQILAYIQTFLDNTKTSIEELSDEDYEK